MLITVNLKSLHFIGAFYFANFVISLDFVSIDDARALTEQEKDAETAPSKQNEIDEESE